MFLLQLNIIGEYLSILSTTLKLITFTYFISFLFVLFSTRWQSNPFTKGAYSYISTDCDKIETSYDRLSQGLVLTDFFPNTNLIDNDTIKVSRNILVVETDTNAFNGKSNVCQQPQSKSDQSESVVMAFAGEACHDKYFSTAHGAFLSGIEQMQKVLAIYN